MSFCGVGHCGTDSGDLLDEDSDQGNETIEELCELCRTRSPCRFHSRRRSDPDELSAKMTIRNAAATSGSNLVRR